jgi:hypothetical protein
MAGLPIGGLAWGGIAFEASFLKTGLEWQE